MKDISNEELLTELKNRFNQKDEIMFEQRKLVKQLEKVNQRLLQSEQIQSRFLSNIRNEINNPLTAILGLAREMMTAVYDREKFQKNVSLIFSESFQLGFQLQNIFLAAEIEAGQSQLYITNVHVNNLLKSTLDNFCHVISRKKLKINFHSDFSNDFQFRTDAEKLKVVLLNLIMNAIEFTSVEGEILLAAYDQGDEELCISIQDHGEGIAEGKIGTIFDRFTQLNNGSTKSHAGHGLGLSVVNSVLDLLEGKIEVVSKVGKGSVFLITVPQRPSVTDVNGASSDGNEFMFNPDDVEIL